MMMIWAPNVQPVRPSKLLVSTLWVPTFMTHLYLTFTLTIHIVFYQHVPLFVLNNG